MVMLSAQHQVLRRLRENESAALHPQTDQKSLARVAGFIFTAGTSSAALQDETCFRVAAQETRFQIKFLAEIVMNCNAKKMPAKYQAMTGIMGTRCPGRIEGRFSDWFSGLTGPVSFEC